MQFKQLNQSLIDDINSQDRVLFAKALVTGVQPNNELAF